MKRRRVKITGIGPVTPAGIGREEFWKGILEPVSRVQSYNSLGEKYGEIVAAHMPTFDITNYIEDRTLIPKKAARHTLFAIAGVVLALRDAGISIEEFRDGNSAIVTGSSLMDFGGIVNAIDSVSLRGQRATQPRVLYETGVSSISSAVNHTLGMKARTMAISTQCCAGMDAIGYAADLISKGEVEMVLCGGSEAPLHRFPLLEFRAAALTPASTELPLRISRPFDLWRTTGVVSEGACMFVLEPDTSSRKSYSYISGYAFANDDATIACSGMTEAGRLALSNANIRPADVDVISAWGPGHKQLDAAESAALTRLFHSALPEIPVVSIKGSIGTPLGAAPAIQIAAAALSQRFSIIPPTVNWEFPDPTCLLNLKNKSRPIEHKRTLVNAHGLGGVNACLILERW